MYIENYIKCIENIENCPPRYKFYYREEISAMVVNIQSVIISFFNFIQNVGSTIGRLELPESIEVVVDIFNDAFSYCLSFLPYFTELQYRTKFVFLTTVIYILLDFLFMWFTREFLENFIHIIDLAIVGLFGYSLACITIDSNTVYLSSIAVCIIFYAIRIYFRYKSMKGENISGLLKIWFSLVGYNYSGRKHLGCLCHELCNFYVLRRVFLNENGDDNLQMLMRHVSVLLGISNELDPMRVRVIITNNVMGLLFFVMGMFLGGTFCCRNSIPAVVQLVAPLICCSFGSFLFVHSLLSLSEGGRRFLLGLRLFLRRWVLKIVILFLNLSYIPILNFLIKNLYSADGELCDEEGQYPLYNVDSSSLFYVFTTYNFTGCGTCTYTDTSYYCSSVCKKSNGKVGYYDTELRYIGDILRPTGLPLFFAAITILFGIPLAFLLLTTFSRTVVGALSFYGRNSDEKWRNAVERLSSSGIFIFSPFKRQCFLWPLVLMAGKLMILIIQTFSYLFAELIYVADIAVYFTLLCLTLRYKPYVHIYNNILDVFLYIGNIAFAAIPIFQDYVTINDSVYVCIAVLAIVFPLLFSGVVLLLGHFCSPNREYPSSLDRDTKREVEHAILDYLSNDGPLTEDEEINKFLRDVREDEFYETICYCRCNSNGTFDRYCYPNLLLSHEIDEIIFASDDISDLEFYLSDFGPIDELSKDALRLISLANRSSEKDTSESASDSSEGDEIPLNTVCEQNKYYVAVVYSKFYLLVDYILDVDTLSRSTVFLNAAAICSVFTLSFYYAHIYIQYTGIMKGVC